VFGEEDCFWALTFGVLTSSLPEVGKLIAPSVAALHATSIEPLQQQLDDAAQHKYGQRRAPAYPLHTAHAWDHQGHTAQWPWIGFLDHATKNLTPQLTNTLRPY